MLFETLATTGHEQVVFCHNQDAGLRAIIAIHNTTLGPALGGVRMRPYASTDDALADALRTAVAEAALGGNEKSRERHTSRGKLLPRERVERLLDPGSPFLEIGQLAAHGEAATRAAALAPMMPAMRRLALWPAETLLAQPAPPEEALRGLLVLQGMARQIRAEAEELRLANAEAERRARIGELAVRKRLHRLRILAHDVERRGRQAHRAQQGDRGIEIGRAHPDHHRERLALVEVGDALR